MADLLIAGIGGPGRAVAIMASASARWSKIAFLTVGKETSNGASRRSNGRDDSGTGTHDLLSGAGSRGRDRPESRAAAQDYCGEWPIVGTIRSARELTADFSDLFVAEEANGPRADHLRRMAKLGFFLPCLVHPSAAVCRSAKLDYGCLIAPQATVETDAQLGMGTIVGPGATVGYECAFGLAVHLASGAHLGAGARIGGYTRIGMGAIVTEGVTIGQNVTVAAGAVVTQHIPDGVTVFGSPAAILPDAYATTAYEARSAH